MGIEVEDRQYPLWQAGLQSLCALMGKHPGINILKTMEKK